MTIINWSNVTTAGDFLAAANTATGGYFWTGVLYMFVIILIMALIPFGMEIAILASLFIGIIAGIMLLYLGLISKLWLGILIACELFAIIYVVIMSPRNQ